MTTEQYEALISLLSMINENGSGQYDDIIALLNSINDNVRCIYETIIILFIVYLFVSFVKDVMKTL